MTVKIINNGAVKALNDLQDNAKRAISLSLNATAGSLANGFNKELHNRLGRPTDFAVQRMKWDKSTPDNLRATVYYDEQDAKLNLSMNAMEFGGDRKVKGKNVELRPSKLVQDDHGGMRAGEAKRLIGDAKKSRGVSTVHAKRRKGQRTGSGGGIFVGSPKGANYASLGQGIYRRPAGAGGRIERLVSFGSKMDYHPKLGFFKALNAVADEVSPVAMQAAIADMVGGPSSRVNVIEAVRGFESSPAWSAGRDNSLPKSHMTVKASDWYKGKPDQDRVKQRHHEKADRDLSKSWAKGS